MALADLLSIGREKVVIEITPDLIKKDLDKYRELIAY